MKHQLFVLALICSIAFGANALNFDSNVPDNIKAQMLEDLQFMYGIQSTQQTNLHKQIFESVSGEKYQKFFESHVTAVGLSSCGGGAAVACVMPWFRKKMWLTQNFIKFSHPQVARMMVVYHEARHTESENGNWGHDTCPTPFLDENGKDLKSIWTGAPLAGEPACDSTPFGSYGSSTVLLKNVAMNCSNCGEKVKMDADIYATDQLNRINNPRAKQAMIDDFKQNGKIKLLK